MAHLEKDRKAFGSHDIQSHVAISNLKKVTIALEGGEGLENGSAQEESSLDFSSLDHIGKKGRFVCLFVFCVCVCLCVRLCVCVCVCALCPNFHFFSFFLLQSGNLSHHFPRYTGRPSHPHPAGQEWREVLPVANPLPRPLSPPLPPAPTLHGRGPEQQHAHSSLTLQQLQEREGAQLPVHKEERHQGQDMHVCVGVVCLLGMLSCPL